MPSKTPLNGEKTVALILAAGELTEEWRTVCAEEAVSHRALLQIGNRSMVQIAVDALQNGANVHRLLIAGNLPLPMGCIAVAGGATLLETLLNGVAALSQEETTLLVATADMPFLTADAVREFERKVPSDAGFAYAIVPMERYGEKYPSLRRTTLKLREGVFTGGNLVLLRRDAFVKNREIIEEAYRKRKSIPALAALLGFPILMRLATSFVVPSLLSVSHIEQAVSSAMGVSARAVRCESAEIAADVDTVADLSAARILFQQSV